MRKTARALVTGGTCFIVGACSSIGTVNGVDLNRMGATSAGPQPYCVQNETQQWVCIFAGAAMIGAAAAVIASAHHGSSSTSSSSSSSGPHL